MVMPSTAVAALAVAIYAAVVSSITGLVQVFNYRRDRAQIVLKVGHDMVITTAPMRKGLTIISVMNKGRRPVTIATVGGWSLYPHNPFVIPETHPALPYELKEGQKLIAILPPCDLDLKNVQRWEASDAIGRNYKLNVAPWYARLLSDRRWRSKMRRDYKASQAGENSQKNADRKGQQC
jgi:hypothetical protein